MNKTGKGGNLGLILVIAAVILLVTGVITIPKLNLVSVTSTPSGSGVGYATTLSAGGIDALTGGAVDVNAYAFADDGSWFTGEIQANSQPEQLSTAAPNSLKGYVMLGNDAGQGTDRGSDYYFRKIDFKYDNKGAYVVPDTDGDSLIAIYNESKTQTVTGYDDGTAESTLNITVGSGQTVTSTEIKFAADGDACIGNKDFSRPVGVCFNTTDNGKFDEIRPVNYVGTFEPCDAYAKYDILGKCYILPTDAICDYGEYRFFVVIDAATGSDPTTGDEWWPIIMDKTYYKDDSGNFVEGWCDDSSEGTDYDPGIDGSASAKRSYFT